MALSLHEMCMAERAVAAEEGDRVSIAAHDPRSWGTIGTWLDEQSEGALARTPPFGQRFFADLFCGRPALRPAARFLRWSIQPDDVYAVFDWPGGGAGVHLDADLEYIIVWGADGVPAEYGDWGADQVPPAITHMRRLLPPQIGSAEPHSGLIRMQRDDASGRDSSADDAS